MALEARPLAPSGTQLELTCGDQRVVVTSVGAGLRAYSAGGRDIVAGYGADEMSPGGRGQLLIPFPNRVQGGRYEFGGRAHQLALNEPEAGNAIHGLTRWAEWMLVRAEPRTVVFEHLLHPRPGYPFSLALRVEYELAAGGLAVATKATNVGAEPCPYGSGAHPYLTVGTATVDAAVLHVPARTVLHSDAHGIPTGSAPVAGTAYDFRRPRPIGATRLDNAFTDLDRDDDGLARAELREPDGHASVVLWADAAHPYLMVFSGDTLPDAERRRSLAVEPMTCPPNALRTGEALIRLDPGESFTGRWGIAAGEVEGRA
ncbi:MAG TPA: aldose 1-epimerase family protein [Gaiellales bacterium]|nr:aldose 1-epimerase family protein [Gaiellales bacterium]